MKRWGWDKTRAYLYAIGDLASLGWDPISPHLAPASAY